MKITRRKLFGSLLAAVTAPFAIKAKEEPPEILIRAGDPGADNLEVYNQDTGEIARVFVMAISIGRWIDVLTFVDPTPRTVIWERDANGNARVVNAGDYDLPTIRVPGNWQVRPRPVEAPKPEKDKDVFGYKRQTSSVFPFPVHYQKL